MWKKQLLTQWNMTFLSKTCIPMALEEQLTIVFHRTFKTDDRSILVEMVLIPILNIFIVVSVRVLF